MLRSLLPLSLALVVACGDPVEADAKAPSKKKQGEAAAAPADNTKIAEWKGGEVTAAQMNEKIAGELKALESQFLLDKYEKQVQFAERTAMEAILNAEAKAKGKADIDSLLRDEIEAKTPAPTEAEMQELWGQVQSQFGGATFEQAQPQLAYELIRRKQSDTYRLYIEELKTANNVKINVPYPDLPRIEVPVGENDPMLGDANAPITIVQFAEYQCYYCNRVSPTLDQLAKNYEGKVRIVFKDFPLGNHNRATPAAVAAHCAGEQQKYWEMNRILLGNQQALADSDFEKYAGDLQLDLDKFKACYSSGKYEPIVAADFSQGEAAGVQATPTFFVNGLLVSGAQPYERFAAIVDRELANR